MDMARQLLQEQGFVHASALYNNASPRVLLLAAGFLVAATNLFEAATALDMQAWEPSTPLLPLPHTCIRECMSSAADGVDSEPLVPACARKLADDASPWQAVDRAAHIAMRARRTHSLLQRQLQSACAAHTALAAQLAAPNGPGGGGQAPLSPYEAAVAGRESAYEAHMRDAEAFAAELVQRRGAARHGAAFFAWLGGVHKIELAERSSDGSAAHRLQRSPDAGPDLAQAVHSEQLLTMAVPALANEHLKQVRIY
jgi:hypothetical protein